jgi:hypothetical protein
MTQSYRLTLKVNDKAYAMEEVELTEGVSLRDVAAEVYDRGARHLREEGRWNEAFAADCLRVANASAPRRNPLDTKPIDHEIFRLVWDLVMKFHQRHNFRLELHQERLDVPGSLEKPVALEGNVGGLLLTQECHTGDHSSCPRPRTRDVSEALAEMALCECPCHEEAPIGSP